MKEFDWVIEPEEAWPPRQKPREPMGPTELEIMRSCALRSCFEGSAKGVQRGVYQPKIGYAARIGTAFHRAAESLIVQPPSGGTAIEWAQEAHQRFLGELAKQDKEKEENARERNLLKDSGRINRAIEAIMVEAHRLFHVLRVAQRSSWSGDGLQTLEEASLAATERGIEIEVPVKSKDGKFKGRIDQVESTVDGTVLKDYKSAVRDDLPERYERQLQLYALLWNEEHGDWPTRAEVIYPFTHSVKMVGIERTTCERVAQEYRDLMSHVMEENEVAKLAKPGDVCQVCSFRPWCQAFWSMQSDEKKQMAALVAAQWGFEGEIEKIDLVRGQWKLYVRWRGCLVKIVAPNERFPQLEGAGVGDQVRALEMKLSELAYAPTAIINEASELFVVKKKRTSDESK